MTMGNNTSASLRTEAKVTESAGSGAKVIRGHGFFLSVGAKGWLVFVALLVYLIGIAIFALYQKNLLSQDYEKIQAAIEDETILAQAHVSLFHAIGALTVNFNERDVTAGMRRIQMHQQLFHARQIEVMERFPLRASNAGRVNAAFERTNKDPSQTNLNLLISELLVAESNLGMLIEEVKTMRRSMSEEHRAQSDSAALTVFLLSAWCLLLLGLTVGLFFRRLGNDMRLLQNVALDTVRGIRGRPMKITRNDEVGQLMMVVNSMAETLDRNGQELMLERQKYFHQEKMAAIGALAAGISHEIGNPIAAISGITQEMIDRRAQGKTACGNDECDGCQPELIHAQTVRLAAITREISEFASPRTTEPQLLDLNGQLRSTASLIRYDKRLTHIELRLELDPQLPAIYGVADQLTQIIMNLLINAMDALEGVKDRMPNILIQTGSDEKYAWVMVSDNGCGMAESTLSRVFEAFFTTKPAGKGTGLGLSLCYSIAKAHGGTIDIKSTLGIGTQVQVFFPLNLSNSSSDDSR